jgi:hypothetical protein
MYLELSSVKALDPGSEIYPNPYAHLNKNSKPKSAPLNSSKTDKLTKLDAGKPASINPLGV